MLALRQAVDSDAPSTAFKADAVLGAVEAPRPTVSEALDIYFDEIAIDGQYDKSDRQKYQWRKVKRLSIAYFIEVVSNMPFTDVTRDHAQKFRRFWTDRMVKPKKGEQAVSPTRQTVI